MPKATLRYWEDAGLLPKIKRNQSGYREYSTMDLNWIFYVQALRKAGMPIGKLKKFISMYRDPTASKQRKQMLVEQRNEMVQQINEMQKTINYLNYKIDNFGSHMLNYENEKLIYEKIEKEEQV